MLDVLASIPAGLYALIGTIFGGVGLKVIERWLNRHTVVIDERKDYRDEIADLRQRLDKVEEEVDEWRERYYANEDYINILRAYMYGKGLEPPPRKPLPPKIS